MMKQSNEVQAAQQAARDADYAARVSLAFYNFFKAHWGEGLLSCEANRRALEEYLDANLLDCSDPANIEIAYLAVGSQLARTKKPVVPAPPAQPAVAPPVVLSEQEKLRELVQQFKGDPKGLANAMRARLQTADVHSKTAAQTLPAEYTRERIIKMLASEQRNLQRRFGVQALNDRLQGNN